MHCKIASKIEIEKTAGTTSDLIVNKIANRITKVLKILSQNNSWKENIWHDRKIHRQRHIYIYIYPQKGQHIISDVRAIC